MATRDVDFLSQLERVREEVNDNFSEAHRLLQEREAALLQQLLDIEQKYRDRDLRLDKQREELVAMKAEFRHTLKGKENQETLEAMLAPLDAKLRELEKGGERLEKIGFKWDGELETKLRDVGKILQDLNAPSSADESVYMKKGNPVVVACSHSESNSTKPREFKYPTAIAIEPKTENLFICDGFNNRIQVFTKACEFLFLFKDRMNYPAGIVIHEDRAYVTQYEAHTLCVYNVKKGKLLQSIGKKGNEPLQFNHPNGLDIDVQRNLLYLCDRDNNRIQVMNLPKISINSTLTEVTRPKDIKIFNKEIFIMDQGNPCINVFNEKHQLLRRLITYGNVNSQIDVCYRFIIDQDSNLLFTDSSAGCVSIFTKEGTLLHKIGKKGEGFGELMAPRGIAIDSEGRVIVASRNPQHCIQFF